MVKNGDKHTHTHKKTSQPLIDTEHIKPSRNDCPQKSPNETAWGILMQITSCEILSKVQPMRRMHPAKPLLVVISGRSKTWKAGQAQGGIEEMVQVLKERKATSSLPKELSEQASAILVQKTLRAITVKTATKL